MITSPPPRCQARRPGPVAPAMAFEVPRRSVVQTIRAVRAASPPSALRASPAPVPAAPGGRREGAVRLGEILIESGRLSPGDLARGLDRQRRSGQRLGSTLAELGAVTSDEVARALARQHGVPAALDRHLSGRDPALASRLPTDLARAAWALPVALSRGGDGMSLVVCLRDPAPATLALLRRVTGMPIICAVACERALRRELDATYPSIPAGEDGSVDIDMAIEEDSQPFPALGALGELSLVGLDDQYVARDHSQNTAMATTGVSAVSALAEARRTGASSPRIELAEVATPPPAPLRLEEAVARMAAATTGDQVATLAVDCLRGHWRGALVLAVKGKLALGQHGFGGSLTPSTVEAVVVPLDQPSILRTAHDDRRPFAGEAPIGSTVQDRFLRLFAELGSRTVTVSPIMVRDRAVSLLFAIGPLGPLPEASSTVAMLAHTMGEAFLRIILAGKRAGHRPT